MRIIALDILISAVFAVVVAAIGPSWATFGLDQRRQALRFELCAARPTLHP